MSATTITVAVCTRNRPAVLERCLSSVAALEPFPDEVLVADQSDPAAAKRVRALCSGRFRYVAVEARGLGFSRRAAIDLAWTELIAFTDDDCRVRPDWAGEILRTFRRWPEAGGVTGASRPDPLEPPDPDLPDWVTCWGGPEPRVFREPTDPAEVGGTLNAAFRVVAVRSVGGFDPRFGAGSPLRAAEDTDLLHRLLRARWPVVYSPTVVVSHCPVRDHEAHAANERAYAFGLGAWVASRRAAGDRAPGRYWRSALGRTLFRLAWRAPLDPPGRTRQRWRVAWNLVRGWWMGGRTAASKALAGSRRVTVPSGRRRTWGREPHPHAGRWNPA